MKENYDVIVVGGGHNGLTAAATLARKGKQVLLVEKKSKLGGIAAGDEISPGTQTVGLVNDTTNVRKEITDELGLEKHGLELQAGRPEYLLLGKEGQAVRLSPDSKEAAASIGQFSQKDASAYLEYLEFIDKVRPFINKMMSTAPPDLVKLGTRDIWEFLQKAIGLKRLGNKTMLELLKVAPMCVADYLNEKFETDFIKAGICAPAIYHSYTGPWSSYTMVNLILWECAAQYHIKGGPQQLVTALEKAAVAGGAEIRTDCEVEEVMVGAGNEVEGVVLKGDTVIKAPVVLSSCTPEVTFYHLLKPNRVSYALEYGIRHYRTRGTTAKMDLLVSGDVVFNGQTGVSFARTGNSFDDMEKAFDAVKYRQFSDEPILDIHVPTQLDDSLAPDGHQLLSIMVHFAPYEMEGGWSSKSAKSLGNKVLETLEHYIPGIKKQVVETSVLTPLDFESQYGLTNGSIYHGEHAVDQLLTRPIPECMTYATPIDGLYLGGSGSHPGGGITCAPGFLAANAILKG